MSIKAELSQLPIIALAPTPWNGRRLNRQHILSRLAHRNWRVVYSTGSLSLSERGSTAWRTAPRLDRLEEQEQVLIHYCGRLFPRYPRIPWWDLNAIRRHSWQLKRAAGAHNHDFICYVFHPYFWPYVECLRPRYVVFHAFDAYPVMPDWNERSQEWLVKLLERSDLRIVTFQGISDFFPDHLRGTVRELPNGVDENHFFGAEPGCPEDLDGIPHPRIGCIGTLNAKVDFDLLHAVAMQKPEWHWVLLGKSFLETKADAGEFISSMHAWKAFRALPNVHYLGVRPFEAVSAYASHMDVNTICYRTSTDGWWAYGSPNKVNESLAVGKPVVATPLASVRPFANVIDIAETAQEWKSAIDRAVYEGGVGTPQERRAVAMQNTWEQRVNTLEQWLAEMVQGPLLSKHHMPRAAGNEVTTLSISKMKSS